MVEIAASSPIVLTGMNLPGEGAGALARRKGHFIGAPVTPSMDDDEVLDAPLSVFNELVEAAGVPTQYADVRAASTLDDGNVTLSGLQTVGGVALANNDRVLLAYQDAAAENGLWVAHAGSWTRPTDFDGAGEAVTGATVQVIEGDQAGLWRLTTQGTITIGTTAQTWRAFSLRAAVKVPFLRRNLGDKASEAIALPDARLPNDSDDNNALASLIAEGHRHILLPGGKGLGDNGAYLIETLAGVNNLVSGLRLIGDGPAKTSITRPYTIVDQEVDPEAAALAQVLFGNGGSADPADNLTDIVVRGLTIFDDPGRVKGFREGANLIFVNGVSRLLVEDVHLIGFRGDGITLASGHTSSTELHNFDVTLRNLFIDGIDRNNRNGVSIIDCDRLLVDTVYGVNCTRSGDGTNDTPDPLDPNVGLGMPGLFDFEPDHIWNVIRNVKMRNIDARSCGGSAVALLLRSNETQDVPHQNFDIELNAEGCDNGFTHSGYTTTAIGDDDAIPYQVVVRGTIKGATKAAYRLSGAYGAKLPLVIEDSADAFIGENTAPTVGTRDIDLRGARFTRCGNLNGNTINISAPTRGLRIEGVVFEDCGMADNSVGRAIFIAAGDQENLHFVRNIVNSTGRTTQVAAVVGGYGGTIDDATCRNFANVINFTPAHADNFIPTGKDDVRAYTYMGSRLYDAPSVSNNAVTPFPVTVTGAREGDIVVGISADPALDVGVYLIGDVDANDQVQVSVLNKTGFAYDPPSGVTYRVLVARRPDR